MMQRISKEQLARNLDRVLGAEVGMQGLNTLIFGWFEFKHYGSQYREAVYHRRWLYITEVLELSEYAGYDLSKNEL